jgi:hypothetical protein
MKDDNDNMSTTILSDGSLDLTYSPSPDLAEEGGVLLSSSAKQEEKHSRKSHRSQNQESLRQQQKHRKKQVQKKRHGARNQHRHKIFVKWLTEKFDLEESRSVSSNATSATIPSSHVNMKDCADGNRKSIDDKCGIESNAKTDSHAGDNDTTGASRDKYDSVNQNCDSVTTTIDQHRTSHILDVAGGKGEVSARLTMCHQQRVTMVDPRPADIVDCFERIVLPKIPKKWQQRLNNQREANSDFVRDTIESRFRQLETTFDLDKIMIDWNEDTGWSSSPNTPGSQQDLKELQDAIQDATIILGLHADGATEAIVDAALKYRKPFVVVPVRN